MKDSRHRWERFLCPRDKTYTSDENGFVSIPLEDKHFDAYQPNLKKFSDYRQVGCLVILGEPGIGKTTLLESEYSEITSEKASSDELFLYKSLNRYDSSQSLMEDIFKDKIFLDYLKSNKILNLFLDSLDEGLLNVKIISQVLGDELSKSPIKRLKLKISCRTGAWPNYLESRLSSLFDQEFSVLEVIPLSQANVEMACVDNKIDPKLFVKKVIDQRIVPLAIKPNTLNFLINLYKDSANFPATRTELFKMGCELQCKEENESRNVSGLVGELSSSERFIVAARIAALMIIGNKSNIWIGNDLCSQENILTFEEIILSDPYDKESEKRLSINMVKEVLGTGLFSSRGSNLLGWAHQSYAEFLSTWYLKKHDLPLIQLKSLFFSTTTFEERIIPSLYQASSWMCAQSEEFFQLVLENDPEILLNSDLTQVDDLAKESLVHYILSKIRLNQSSLISDWDARKHLKYLKHKNIEFQIKPILGNPDESREMRNFAIDLAEACNVVEVLNELIEIALSKHVDIYQKVNATYAVTRIGDTASKLKLIPLLTDENDYKDELKGCVLSALWPNHISIEDILSYMTAPKKRFFYGAYASFLLNDFPRKLKKDNLLATLKWARKNVEEEESVDRISSVIDSIIEFSWLYLDDDQIFHEFSLLLSERMHGSDSILKDSSRSDFLSNYSKDILIRKKIFAHLINHLSDDELEKMYYFSLIPLLSNVDPEWVIAQYEEVSNPKKKKKIAAILRLTTSFKEDKNIALIRKLSERYEEIASEFKWHLGPIILESEDARQMKKSFEDEKKYQNKKKKNWEEELPKYISEVFADLDNHKDPADLLVHGLRLVSCDLSGGHWHDEIMNLQDCEGWQFIDDDKLRKIIKYGKSFILKFHRDIFSTYKENSYDHDVNIGLKLLRFFLKTEPLFLETQDNDFWARWAPPLLLYPTWNHYDDEIYQKLISMAYLKANEVFKSTIIKIIEAEAKSENHYFFIFGKIEKIIGQDFAKEILSHFEKTKIAPTAMINLCARLIDFQVEDAEKLLSDFFIGTSDVDENSDILNASVITFYSSRIKYWQKLFEEFVKNPEFGKRVLLSKNAQRDERNNPKFLNEISDQALTELCIWMIKAFPYEEGMFDGPRWVGPKEDAERLRGSLISILVNRGTRESCEGIRKISSIFPQHGFLKYNIIEAEKRMRVLQWQPPKAHEILMLIKKSNNRLVRSHEELVNCIIESLEKLETILHGETPAVNEIWNTERNRIRPKTEDEFSDKVKRFLVDELKRKGIIVNREVEIKSKPNGARTDIYVDAITKDKLGNNDALSIIIESKGCWHNELYSAMEDQLAKKYLTNGKTQYGVFLIASNLCDSWDNKDSRKKNSQRNNCQNNELLFYNQAVLLRDNGFFITPFVMDTRYRRL